MQAYKDQLSDEDIAAIVTYERNAWENNTDDTIQPSQVAQIRIENNQKPILVKKAHAGDFR
jgi:cytochrome c oxidase subunit 2